MQQEHADEILEICWIMEERNELKNSTWESVAEGLRRHEDKAPGCALDVDVKNLVAEMSASELLRQTPAGIVFTEEGKRKAAGVIRRHRLAEKLFTDVLELPYSHSESAACKLEHIVSEEVTDNVCSFLGHPPLCPHGKPIPRGACCRRFVVDIKPIVVPMSDLAPGNRGKIVFISSLHSDRLQRLSSLGILPGAEVVLNQKLPSFVISLGETQIALDKEIVSEIYIRKGGV